MRIIAFAVLLLLIAAPASAADIDAVVEDVLALENTPGAAVTIVRPGAAPFARGYGVRRIGRGGKVDARTLFGLASATKAFTALSVAILAEEDALSLDDSVRAHLPGFSVADPYVSQHATIRDLLAHRTGTIKGDIVWFANPNASDASLVALFAGLPQETSFREGFSYSNLMYAAAGEIIRVQSGETWRAFVEKRILRPLGMADTLADRAAARAAKNIAALHAFDGASIRAFDISTLPDNTAPAGGIYSSAADMAKWLQFWIDLSAGEETTPALEAPLYRELTRFQNIVADRSPIDDFMHDADAPYGYGLGWFIGDYRGRKVLTHMGGGEGAAALVSWMPAEKVGVAVLMNAEGALGRIAIRNAAFDEALGVDDTDWTASFGALLGEYRAYLRAQAQDWEEKQRAEPASRTPLASYVGAYRHETFGKISVEVKKGGLHATLGGARTYALKRWAGDSFAVMIDNPAFSWPAPALLRFKTAADGAVTGLAFEAAGQSADYGRTDE